MPIGTVLTRLGFGTAGDRAIHAVKSTDRRRRLLQSVLGHDAARPGSVMDLDAARRPVIGRTLRCYFTPVQLNRARREFLVRALRNGSKPPRDVIDEAIYATLRGYRVQPMF